MKLFCKSIFTIVVLSSLFSGCTTDDEHNNLKKEFDDNKKELIILAQKRLKRMLLNGITSIEAKSGYGLDFENEIKKSSY